MVSGSDTAGGVLPAAIALCDGKLGQTLPDQAHPSHRAASAGGGKTILPESSAEDVEGIGQTVVIEKSRRRRDHRHRVCGAVGARRIHALIGFFASGQVRNKPSRHTSA